MSLVGNTNSRGEVQGNLSANQKMSGSVSLPKMIQGKSAYESAVIFGFKGTEEEWLASLEGADGRDGENGRDGTEGLSVYLITQPYLLGATYTVFNGARAYIPEGHTLKVGDLLLCTEDDYAGKIYRIENLNAPSSGYHEALLVLDIKGKDGEKGDDGKDGKNGYSIFTTNGYVTKITDTTAIVDTERVNYFDARGFQIGDIIFDTKSGELWRMEATSGSQMALSFLFSIGSGAANTAAPVRIAEINLLSANWIGTDSPYSQVVTIDGITENSMVNLQPSAEQLSTFHDKDLAFVAENEDGVVTVYAIGDKPLMDYTIQVSITEVYE